MEEISNIMYNNNSRQIYEYNHNTLRQKNSPSTNNHTIINDINVAQQQKNEKNKNNNTSRTNRKKTKGVERNYELSYNAKIIDSKYRKKSHEYLYNTIDKKFNTSNKNTNLSIDFYSKTAKKTDAFRENKSFINSLSKSNELNNKPSIITQEKVIKRIDIPSSISKFTIEANSKKPKTAKNKKNEEKKPINENTKINPFKIDEEKSSRKKTFDVNKIIIKKEIKQEKEKEELYEITYDIKDLSLSLIGNKDILKNISLLKQYEQRYKKNIYDEPNTNSDFSNPNSNNNLIGIKSPSGRSETSEKNNSNKNIILEKDLKEEINNYKYKQSFTYRAKFKKDIEKEAEKLFQNCRYSIGKNYDNNFDITIYGNDEDEFNEEKNTFEKQYKQEMIDCDTTIDMNERKKAKNKIFR